MGYLLLFFIFSDNGIRRRRLMQQNTNEHVCSVYMYADPFLWRKVYKVGKGKMRYFSQEIKATNQLKIELVQINSYLTLSNINFHLLVTLVRAKEQNFNL